MMPSMSETGGGSGRASATRRPGDWLVGGFDTTSRWVTVGLFVGLGGYLFLADQDDVRSLGDATQAIPLTAALGLSIGVGDWQGLKQLGLSGGTAFALTHGIKEVVDKNRPDDTANNSFPSGHTSASVTGAAFIWRRYGPKWGAPAAIIAAYTGFSRVEGQKHFMDDVISGAAVGLISNLLWTDPVDERVRMALFPTKGGAGVNVSFDPTAQPGLKSDDDWKNTIPLRSFAWEMGGTHLTRNDVRSPAFGDENTDFRFDQENDPTMTAGVAINWFDRKLRYSVFAAFAPFEIRETVELEDDVSFSGATLPSGTTVQSRYLAYDYRVGAGAVLLRRGRTRLTVGGSLALFDTEVALTGDEVEIAERVTAVRPLVMIGLESVLGRRWLTWVTLHWWSDSSMKIADGTAQVGYRLHSKWAMTLGYRRVERKVNVEELYNKVSRNQIALGVVYMW